MRQPYRLWLRHPSRYFLFLWAVLRHDEAAQQRIVDEDVRRYGA